MRKAILAILTGTLFSLASPAQPREKYQQGIALMDRAHFTEALNQFRDVLNRDPGNTECLLKLAETFYLMGHADTALIYLKTLEELDPARGSYHQASIYAEMGNPAKAVNYLERHLGSVYKKPYDQIVLDNTFTGIEESKEWKLLWKKDWYSEDDLLLQELRYLTGGGEHLQALEIIDEELKTRTGWDELYAARGRVLLEMDQYQGAIQAFTMAIDENSSNQEHYYGRSKAYLAAEKYEEAIPDLKKTRRMDPDRLDLILECGEVLHAAGRYDEAAEYLEEYLAFYPDDIGAHFLSGHVFFDTGKHLKALEKYNLCLRLDNSKPEFFTARGKTYLETRTYKYALKDFGMALDLDPKDADVWYLKGQARWQLNEREGAMNDWEQAARLGSFEAAEKIEEYGPR